MPRVKPNRALVVLLFVAILGGVLWSLLANPAQYTVAFGNPILDEGQVEARFSVIMVYVAIGFVFSFAWGWWAVRYFSNSSVLIILIYLTALSFAALIAYRVGVAFGPTGFEAMTEFEEGAKLTERLSLDGPVPGVSWLIGGFLGLLSGLYQKHKQETEKFDSIVNF